MRRLAALLALLPLAALANPKETIDLLFASKTIDETALAPDGKRLLWVEKQHHADRTPSRNYFIFVLDGDNPTPRRVTAGNGTAAHAEKNARWSPDGRQLAFLSDAVKEKQLQLYLTPAAGGATRALTNFSGQMDNVRWSPDGRTIALLVIEGQTQAAGAVEAASKDAGEVAETIFEQRVMLVDVATGGARLVTPPDMYVYEFDWSPDGKQLAYIAAPGNGDNNWWIARLYALDVTGGKPRELFKPTTQIAVPRWSPDGSTIAFIQGLMSDAGVTGGDIWSVTTVGGDAKNLTPGRHSSPAWLAWLKSEKLLFTEYVRGSTAISTLDVVSGKTETLWTGAESIGATGEAASLSLSANGECALVRSSWERAADVWSGPIGKWTQRSRVNDSLKPLWGHAESVEWTCDGRAVQGWLVPPRTVEVGRRYPMIVAIHGGPASVLRPVWPGGGLSLAALASEDYFVFLPNPRGSYGQGEAFTAANVKDFGHGDLRDIMAGVDAVLAKFPAIDPARLGVGGWSYGGFMAMWTVTQTNRFRAAVAGAGIVNWQSYYGQNLIDQWMIPYFGASVYDDPAAYARSSPINFIKAVKTPTLVVVGDSDKECPAPQSYEFWHALKMLGVETKFVVYEGEGHHFRKPKNIEDLVVRTIGWFDAKLK